MPHIYRNSKGSGGKKKAVDVSKQCPCECVCVRRCDTEGNRLQEKEAEVKTHLE